MKNHIRTFLICAGICCASSAVLAQAGYGALPANSSSSDANQTSTYSTNGRETHESVLFQRSKEFVGANVKDAQGEKIGDVYDLFFNPRTGETFAAIDRGHDIYAIVPPQALTITPGTGVLGHKADVTLNTSREAVENGPTITKNEKWQKLDVPEFTRTIYAHYKIQAPPPVGGVGAGALGGVLSGSGIGTNHINKPTTGKR